ncbi:sulfatase-like hydrolase/transferase [Flammeovirga kamogawensis]|uniref:Sulfatase-like hydrolase/transferase n=1 Tax=Flammeovirga kamogawensis TaxID=373891 RepID=A0ABX8H4Z7_9BACT|nr:sulfatase-like hydrolase/transferase [Flammeovirga kamogawensis]MBB6460474.1 arylsulfatase A-like enzyme [Flammeovirga kamogawensis]QWG10280.1 sulfatase-like hydrolase/transferase [Flammeovirga kamogawensis]
MRHLLSQLFLLLLLTTTLFGQKKSSDKTNLLFIITDQQRFDAIGKAGTFKFLKTPNIDKLADEGAYFTNAYTPCAVCAPARTSILTGQTVENHGVRKNDYAYNAPDEGNYCNLPSFDQVLIENGYYGEYLGKYHSPIHLTEGYSEFAYKKNKHNVYTLKNKKTYQDKVVAYLNTQGKKVTDYDLKDKFFKNYYTPDPIDMRYKKGDDYRRTHVVSHKEMKISQPDGHGKLHLPDNLSLTNYQTETLRKALKRASKQEKPFNLTVSYFFPHSPMLPTEPWYSMYNPEDMPIPESIKDDMKTSPYKNGNNRKSMPEYSDPEKVKYMMSNYFGLISEIDHYLGKIISDLEKYDMDENTLIIFTSDHGEMLGAHGMREKNVFYEESAHIPLIMWYPGRIQPTKVTSPVSLIDLYPTIMDYLDVEGGTRDGASLRTIIEGKEVRKYTVTEWDYNGPKQPNYMVVSNDGWKFITSYSTDRPDLDVLYNLNDDPNEVVNLIRDNPNANQYKNKVEELKGYLIEWLEKNNSSRVNLIKNRTIL